MKQAIIAGACIIALATLGACSNTTESSASNTPNQPVSSAAPTTESPATPANLTGTWKGKNPNEDSYQIARVTADTIEITPFSDRDVDDACRDEASVSRPCRAGC